MKEQLYTIPVSDAFLENTECPVCSMKKSLEANAITYTMGPSYMEDDVRAETDKAGFCEKHLRLMYENQNRLGLALILSTHMDEVIKNLEQHSSAGKAASPFKKSREPGVGGYIGRLKDSCFVCARMDHTLNRYVATIFHLYRHEKEFADTFRNCRGFCTGHYGLLYDAASSYLKGDTLHAFRNDLNTVFLENMKRVRADLEWFKDKFDYRNADAPWESAQDALPRTMTKLKGILMEEP